MSAVIEKFLVCDGVGCDATYGVDMRHKAIDEHRKKAKAEGWTYNNGKDYCPTCRAKGIQYQKKIKA